MTRLADDPAEDRVRVRVEKSVSPAAFAHRVVYMDGEVETVEFHGDRQRVSPSHEEDAWYVDENGIRRYYRAYDATLERQQVSTSGRVHLRVDVDKEQTAQVVLANVRRFEPTEPETPPERFSATSAFNIRRKHVRPGWEIIEDPRDSPDAPADADEADVHGQGRRE